MKQLIKMLLISIIAMAAVFAFIVFEVSATPLSLTQAQCDNLPGEWSGGATKTCTVTSTATITQPHTIENKQSLIIAGTGSLTIQDGGSLTIQNGGDLTIENGGSLTNNGTISNSGDLNIISGSSLVNSGTISTSKRLLIRNSTLIVNSGSSLTNTNILDIFNGGKLTIKSGGNLTNNDPGVLTIQDNGSFLDNNGTLDNNGDLTIKMSSSLTNSSTISNTGALTITTGGSLANTGTVTNQGMLTSEGDLTNDDTLDNSGSLTIESGGNLTNTRTLNNSGSLAIKNNGSLIIDHSTLNNNGSLTIENGGSLTVNGHPLFIDHPLFFDDMESGGDNWDATGLWHLEDDSDPCGNSFSPTTSFYYGQSPLCNYDIGTNSGQLTTVSPIALPASGNPDLSFQSWEEKESVPTYDTRKAFISTDGVSFTEIFNSTNNTATWHQVQIDLSAYAGRNIWLRFKFDTVDDIANNFTGWYIDDVRIGERISISNTGYLINYGTFRSSGLIRNDNYLYNGDTGDLINDGPSGVLANTSTGTFYNSGHLANKNGGSLINEKDGTFYNFDDFGNEGDFENQGQVNPAISGPITLSPVHHEPIIILIITNNGTLTNTGVLNNTGILNNNYELDNLGSLTNAGSLINSGIFSNTTNQTITGTVTNQGVWTNNYMIYNYGEFANLGIIYSCNGVITGTVKILGNLPQPCAGNIHLYLPIVLKGG